MRIANKPNFRVKHPYSYLIHSILLGIILLFSAVLSMTLIKFDNDKKNVDALTSFTGSPYGGDGIIGGSGTAFYPYLIDSWDEFCFVQYYLKNNSSNPYAYYSLVDDITISSSTFTYYPYSSGVWDESNTQTITNHVSDFYGCFIGNGHTITINSNSYNTAMFLSTRSLTSSSSATKTIISNFKVKLDASWVYSATTSSNTAYQDAVVVKDLYSGNVDNIKVNIPNTFDIQATSSASTYTSYSFLNYAGIIVGKATSNGGTSRVPNITNCYVYAPNAVRVVANTKVCFGGIVGSYYNSIALSGASIEDCSFEGVISPYKVSTASISGSASYKSSIAGIVGGIYTYGSSYKLLVNNCFSHLTFDFVANGTTSSYAYNTNLKGLAISGVVGNWYISTTRQYATISNCRYVPYSDSSSLTMTTEDTTILSGSKSYLSLSYIANSSIFTSDSITNCYYTTGSLLSTSGSSLSSYITINTSSGTSLSDATSTTVSGDWDYGDGWYKCTSNGTYLAHQITKTFTSLASDNKSTVSSTSVDGYYEYRASTAEELNYVCSYILGSNTKIILEADIDMSQYIWNDPLDLYTNWIIDGQGYTISNIYFTDSELSRCYYYSSLADFSHPPSLIQSYGGKSSVGELKNVTFSNVTYDLSLLTLSYFLTGNSESTYAQSDIYFGGIMARPNGAGEIDITNTYLENATFNCSTLCDYTGSYIGYSSSKLHIGGIFGSNNNYSTAYSEFVGVVVSEIIVNTDIDSYYDSAAIINTSNGSIYASSIIIMGSDSGLTSDVVNTNSLGSLTDAIILIDSTNKTLSGTTNRIISYAWLYTDANTSASAGSLTTFAPGQITNINAFLSNIMTGNYGDTWGIYADPDSTISDQMQHALEITLSKIYIDVSSCDHSTYTSKPSTKTCPTHTTTSAQVTVNTCSKCGHQEVTTLSRASCGYDGVNDSSCWSYIHDDGTSICNCASGYTSPYICFTEQPGTDWDDWEDAYIFIYGETVPDISDFCTCGTDTNIGFSYTMCTGCNFVESVLYCTECNGYYYVELIDCNCYPGHHGHNTEYIYYSMTVEDCNNCGYDNWIYDALVCYTCESDDPDVDVYFIYENVFCDYCGNTFNDPPSSGGGSTCSHTNLTRNQNIIECPDCGYNGCIEEDVCMDCGEVVAEYITNCVCGNLFAGSTSLSLRTRLINLRTRTTTCTNPNCLTCNGTYAQTVSNTLKTAPTYTSGTTYSKLYLVLYKCEPNAVFYNLTSTSDSTNLKNNGVYPYSKIVEPYQFSVSTETSGDYLNCTYTATSALPSGSTYRESNLSSTFAQFPGETVYLVNNATTTDEYKHTIKATASSTDNLISLESDDYTLQSSTSSTMYGYKTYEYETLSTYAGNFRKGDSNTESENYLQITASQIPKTAYTNF